MDGKIKSSFSDAYQRLSQLTATEDDVLKIASVLRRRLQSIPEKQLSQFGFKEHEFDCLLFLLRYATKVPNLQKEQLLMVNCYQEAKEILHSKKGRSDYRIKKALAAFGVAIKPVEEQQKTYIKFCYENLYSDPGEATEKGKMIVNFYHVNGSEYPLIWKNNPEKKRAIIDVLAKAFGINSHDALIQMLKRLKTKNLPAFKNSGMNNQK